MGRPCRCCRSEITCNCTCFCNPDNPNFQDGEECSPPPEGSPSPATRSGYFDLYDFTLLICNSNAAKDDEWEVTLNNVNFGNISELGENICKGKFFTTSDVMLEKIRREIFDDSNPDIDGPMYCETVHLCCLRNTFEQSEHKNVSRQSFNFCGTNPIRFKRTKNNNNGNFGDIVLFRTGPSSDHPNFYNGCPPTVRRNPRICVAYRGHYSMWSDDVGLEYSQVITQECCFCNFPTREFSNFYTPGFFDR